jgi:hypothetical protein
MLVLSEMTVNVVTPIPGSCSHLSAEQVLYFAADRR